MGRDNLGFGGVPLPAIRSPPPLVVPVGVNKLNTQIPVEELLEALKRLKRAELEAEQTEDESASSHGAGRMAEYQVWFSFAFLSNCTVHAVLPTPVGHAMQAASASPRIWANPELIFLLCSN